MTDRELAAVLIAKNVHFFHAMNLRDFSAYCRSRSLLSRTEMIESDPDYTEFWSDEIDSQRGVLSRVFGNVYDFAAIFARARDASSPNIYGPVTLVFSPEVYEEMVDIVLTQRSIVELEDPWRASALNDVQIDEMLEGSVYGDAIAAPYSFTEVSCANPWLEWRHLKEVVVEPLVVGEVDLVGWVQQEVVRHQISVPVRARRYSNAEHLDLLQHLVSSFEAYVPVDDRPDRVPFKHIPPEIERMPKKYVRRYELWATYFFNGTVAFLREQRE